MAQMMKAFSALTNLVREGGKRSALIAIFTTTPITILRTEQSGAHSSTQTPQLIPPAMVGSFAKTSWIIGQKSKTRSSLTKLPNGKPPEEEKAKAKVKAKSRARAKAKVERAGVKTLPTAAGDLVSDGERRPRALPLPKVVLLHRQCRYLQTPR